MSEQDPTRDRPLLRSLRRTTKHLPNATSDAMGRIRIPDTTLLVLKGHLLIEADLIDICGRLLKKPDVLETERVGFALRLKLVRALVGDDAMPDSIWHAIEDLNRIRNKLAHHLEPKDIDKELHQFLGRFDEIEDFRIVLRDEKSMRDRLVSCFLFLCGALSGIGKSDDTHASKAGHC